MHCRGGLPDVIDAVVLELDRQRVAEAVFALGFDRPRMAKGGHCGGRRRGPVSPPAVVS
jgi:hypothetical protein